ncbi:MAG: transglycosylase SLT domain-containing protein [Chloroflexi bacterium]|nr:transglycosylase SLT domain-containing protein [Chloroflexota bacterium]
MDDEDLQEKKPWSRPFWLPKARLITDRDEVRAKKAEMDRPQPTVWWLAVRFIPLWILLLVVLLVEPTLPFRAIAAVFGGVFNRDSADPVYIVEPVYVVEGAGGVPEVADLPAPDWDLEISPVFTRQVQYWRSGIANWSLAYRVEPNLIGTIMQIESCGNPQALSPAQAQGLFQVLPLHFEEGEDPFHPETNAKRGLLFYGELLAATNGDTSLSFAAYNGGPRMIGLSPTQWPQETQNYQFWASGIYEEAQLGLTQSPTLIEWLEAGGSSLCAEASRVLGIAQ